MHTIHHISWLLFFAISGTLLVLWLLTARTQVGRRIIDEETPWNIRQWSRLLAVLGTTAFILVNPISHLLGLLVLGGLYHFLVGDIRQAKNLLVSTNAGKTRSDLSGSADDPLLNIRLTCTVRSDQRLVASRQAVEKCLFSFPYIDLDIRPRIHHIDGKFEIETKLSNSKYLSSLMDYLRVAGFEVSYKNKIE